MDSSVGGEPPADILIERQVDEIIEAGFLLPRWGWKTPGPYNGATGAERVRGWQKVRIAEMLGLLPRRERCSGCGGAGDHRHAENYFRPLFSLPVCRSCHYQVHKRFARPERWQEFLCERIEPQSWFRHFSTTPITRETARRIAEEGDLVSALSRYSADRQ